MKRCAALIFALTLLCPGPSSADDFVSLLESLPKSEGQRPALKTKQGLPLLYAAGVQAIKKRPEPMEKVPAILAAYRGEAEAGDAVAQLSLSQFYYWGLGIPEDKPQAFIWVRKAADQGLAIAANNVGAMYLHGYGIPKDESEAVRWYRKSADAGDPLGEFNLGWAYYNGIATAQDKDEALTWFRKSAEQGLASAYNWIALMYEKGEGGLRRDMAEACRWSAKAADVGNAAGQRNVGECYAWGLGGLQRSPETAARWFKAASLQGDEKVAEELRKYVVQSQAAVRDKNFPQAADLLLKARFVAPWSELAWYNLALVSAETARYQNAISAMEVFLALAPDAPQARGARDLVYEWELKVKK